MKPEIRPVSTSPSCVPTALAVRAVADGLRPVAGSYRDLHGMRRYRHLPRRWPAGADALAEHFNGAHLGVCRAALSRTSHLNAAAPREAPGAPAPAPGCGRRRRLAIVRRTRREGVGGRGRRPSRRGEPVGDRAHSTDQFSSTGVSQRVSHRCIPPEPRRSADSHPGSVRRRRNVGLLSMAKGISAWRMLISPSHSMAGIPGRERDRGGVRGCRLQPPGAVRHHRITPPAPRCRVLSPVLGQSMNCPGNGDSYSRLCAAGVGVLSRDCRLEVARTTARLVLAAASAVCEPECLKEGNHNMGLARPGWPAWTFFRSMSALRFELAAARKGAPQPAVIARRGHPLAGVAAVPVPACFTVKALPTTRVLGSTTLAAIDGRAQADVALGAVAG